MRQRTWTHCILYLLAALLALSCGQSRRDVEALQRQTETIHDEAMKGIADMNRVGRQLKEQLATLDSIAPRRDSIYHILSRMNRADEDMQNWMMNYKAPDKLSAAEALQYLQGQKQAIDKNLKDIENALAEARQLLKK